MESNRTGRGDRCLFGELHFLHFAVYESFDTARVKSARAGRGAAVAHVRFAPIATELVHCREVSRNAESRLMHRSKRHLYSITSSLHSITSSARSRNDSGIVRPRALAVVRLITRSNLVGCSTGISAGLVPRRILSAKLAARRNMSEMLGP